MLKKLTLIGFSLFFASMNAEQAPQTSSENNDKKDKYDEWCDKFGDLKQEQLRMMARFLRDVDEELFNDEKIKDYQEKFKGDFGYHFASDENLANFGMRLQSIIMDPLLLKRFIQIISISALDMTYALPDSRWELLNRDDTFSKSDEELFAAALKNSIKKCRRCIKKKLQEKKNEIKK